MPMATRCKRTCLSLQPQCYYATYDEDILLCRLPVTQKCNMGDMFENYNAKLPKIKWCLGPEDKPTVSKRSEERIRVMRIEENDDE